VLLVFFKLASIILLASCGGNGGPSSLRRWSPFFKGFNCYKSPQTRRVSLPNYFLRAKGEAEKQAQVVS
jgi:hypothetical protein